MEEEIQEIVGRYVEKYGKSISTTIDLLMLMEKELGIQLTNLAIVNKPYKATLTQDKPSSKSMTNIRIGLTQEVGPEFHVPSHISSFQGRVIPGPQCTVYIR